MVGAERHEPFSRPILHVGRYAVFDEIAHGGFASIHLGRAVGAGGFARTVAVKRLHAQYAKDPEVSAMFLDEARVVARIRHPNVCPTLDLIAEDDELFIVMEYIEGVTLRHLLRDAAKRKRHIPLGVALKVMAGALHGLQAPRASRASAWSWCIVTSRPTTSSSASTACRGSSTSVSRARLASTTTHATAR